LKIPIRTKLSSLIILFPKRGTFIKKILKPKKVSNQV